MPSAADFQTKAKAQALAASYVVLVQEHLGQKDPMNAAGTTEVLNAGNYTLHFTVSTVPTVRTLVAVKVWTATKPGALPLYFLPWRQNAATKMTIPAGSGGPGIFMTSMLSGCTVQVHGTAANPTITHANARQKYSEAVIRLKRYARGWDPEDKYKFAETRANQIATAEINRMLPATGGAASGTVRKADYAGKLTRDNVIRAQRSFIDTLPTNEAMKSYEVQKIGLKPKTGAFVFGIRDPNTDAWAFYCQSAVEIEAEVEDKFGGGPKKTFSMDSAVLGRPELFFP